MNLAVMNPPIVNPATHIKPMMMLVVFVPGSNPHGKLRMTIPAVVPGNKNTSDRQGAIFAREKHIIMTPGAAPSTVPYKAKKYIVYVNPPRKSAPGPDPFDVAWT